MNKITNNIDDIYNFWCYTPSNMIKEIQTIHQYALECNHITEFGFGLGRSGSAILAARPKTYITYDVRDYGPRHLYENIAIDLGIDFRFILASSIEVDIEPTEMIFIDSWHTFDHKTKELNRHNANISKYILIHDTRTCGYVGEDGSEPGYLQAIRDFLLKHENWYLKEIKQDGNGIVVLSCLEGYRKLTIDSLRG